MPKPPVRPYKLRPAARHDLEAIWDYGVTQWSMGRVEAYMDQLFQAFDLLTTHPEITRERQELPQPVRIYRCISHVILYRIADDYIDIIRIRHGRENWYQELMGEG